MARVTEDAPVGPNLDFNSVFASSYENDQFLWLISNDRASTRSMSVVGPN